jgi:serine/threonine protein kinase
LNGLAYAHQARIPSVELADGTVAEGIGLVHRDLKPDNLFLDNSGGTATVKIGDYGLAKAFQMAGLSGYTKTGKARGTPQFMPRQQVIDFKYSGPEIDVWAVAACLYNILTGRFPRDFTAGNPWHTVLHTAPVPIRRRDSSIAPGLALVIDRALDDRGDELTFSSAMELLEALKSESS